MPKSFHIDELRVYLKEKKIVTIQELMAFYQQFTPDLSMSTLRWRVYELKQQKILYSPKRGQYALQEKEIFNPNPTKKMDELALLLQSRFPDVKFSIYPAQWIGNLSNHIYQTTNMIVEIDADVLDAAFYFLKENFTNTYLTPDEKMYTYYISPQEENIILNRLYVDAPVAKVKENYYIPKLEKLVVDLLINEPIIFPVGESEIKTIIMNATDTYSVSLSTLMRYAKKRHALKKWTTLHLTEGTTTN